MPTLKTVLVTGSNGQLGQSLQNIAKHSPHYHFTFINRSTLDLSDSAAIDRYFQHHQFDIIVNCAAYTAVDKAESEIDLADKINHLAVSKLATIAVQTNTLLIHISTDYVYDGCGHSPYVESATTNPQSVYGLSKLQGEQAIQASHPRAIIIRTSWVYSEFGHNFVKTMLKLGQDREQLSVIFDQIGSPTYAGDLANAIIKIMDNSDDNKSVELYHYSNEGVCSWYDFAKAIFELSAIQCEVSPITTKEYPTPAKRPHYSLLNKNKIKVAKAITIPYWKDSLQTCLHALHTQPL